MAPLTGEGSGSSDYFQDDDPEFLKALSEVKLPGDPSSSPSELSPPPCAQPPRRSVASQKRQRDTDDEDEDDTPRSHRNTHNVLASIDDDEKKSEYMNNYTYGASRFGEFGEYMTRKRAKLQVQNADMDDGEGLAGLPGSRIFQGLQIYVSTLFESVSRARRIV